MDRFWKKVDKRGPDDCWEWQAGFSRLGYGRFHHNGESTSAHRVSYELWSGHAPVKGLLVCHTCDNRACVNPSHLYLGTYKDNAVDRVVRNRGGPPRGSSSPHAKLTENQVGLLRLRREFLKEPYTKLGSRFGISESQARKIVSYKNWSN